MPDEARRAALRRAGELVLPGTAIGLVAGATAGVLAAVAGLGPGYALATGAALGVPLGLAGAGYNAALATGRGRLGSMSFGAAYWLPAFPLCRLGHELALDLLTGQPLGLPDDVVPFLVFQALLSVGFAVGFVWLHERVAPYWWVRVRHHNPVAAAYVERYVRQAVATPAGPRRPGTRSSGRGAPAGPRRWGR